MAKAPLVHSTWSGAGLATPGGSADNVYTTPDMGSFGGGMPDIDSYFSDLVPSDLDQPAQQQGAAVYYSPSQKKFVVGGQEIEEVNETALAQAAQQNLQPTANPGGDYTPVDQASWSQFIQNIIDPSLGRLASRNFGIGVDNLQQLAGAGLSFLGAEETGGAIIEQQNKDLANTSVYQRNFTDIGSSPERGAIDWFVANLAQQGPNLIESAVTALAGAAVGTATGGPGIGTVGGALAGLLSKQSFKSTLTTAAKKYVAKEALNEAETKALKQAAGAFGATVASNYAMGVSDIYNEGLETGTDNRAAAALGGIPYAALETLPEYFLVGRVLSEVGGNKALANTFRQKALQRAKAVGGGALRQAGQEGTTELSQEALLLMATTNDWDDPATVNRFVNAFAAGAGVGGAVGAFGGGLQGRFTPTDMLNPAANPETGGVVGTQGELFSDLPEQTNPGPDYTGLSSPLPTQPSPQTDLFEQDGGVQLELPLGSVNERGAMGLPVQQRGTVPGTTEAGGAQQDLFDPAVANQVAMERGRANITAMQQRLLRGRNIAEASQFPGPTVQPASQPASQLNPADLLGDQAVQASQPMRQNAVLTAQQNKLQQQLAARQNQQAVGSTSPTPAASPQEPVVAQVPPADAPASVGANTVEQVPPGGVPSGMNSKPLNKLLAEGRPFNAAQEGTQQQGSVIEREQAPQGRQATKASRGDSLKQGRKKQAEGLEDTIIGKYVVGLDPKTGKWGVYVKNRSANKRGTTVGLWNTRDNAVADAEEKNDRLSLGKKEAKKKTPAKKPQAAEAASPAQETTPAPIEQPVAAEPERPSQPKGKVSEVDAAIQRLDFVPSYGDLNEQQQQAFDDDVETLVSATLEPSTKQKQRGEHTAAAEMLRFVLGDATYSEADFYEAVRLGYGKSTEETMRAIMADADPKPKHTGNKALKDAEKHADKTTDVDANFDKTVDEGNFLRAADGNPIDQPMGQGDIRLKVKQVLSKFKIKPNVVIVKNVEDLKTRMPALYKRAKAARANDDFDQTPAYAYAFGDNIIIYSDMIADERQLTFTVLHETLGHIGLRALVGPKNVATELMNLYNSDRRVANSVEAYRSMRGINNTPEAVEEWLADNIARLETSFITRAWRSVQRMLSKAGIKLGDEAAIPLMYAIRKNARGEGSHFSAAVLKANMQAVMLEKHEGRFQTDTLNADNLGSRYTASLGMKSAGYEKNIADAVDWLKDTGLDTKEIIRRGVSFVETLDFKAARNEGLSTVLSVFAKSANHTKKVLSRINDVVEITHKGDYWGLNKNAPTKQDRAEAGEALALYSLYRGFQVTEEMIDNYPDLYDPETGKINPDVMAQIEEATAVTREEMAEGFVVPAPEGTGPDIVIPGVQLSAKGWQIFEEQRKAMRMISEELLLSHYNKKMGGFAALRDLLTGETELNLPIDVAQDVQAIAEKYVDMWERAINPDGSVDAAQRDRANTFMVQITRAFHNNAKLRDWLEGQGPDKEEASEQFRTPEFQPYIDRLQRVHDAFQQVETGGVELQDVIQARVQPIINSLVQANTEVRNAERMAKKTLLSAYVPLFREGKYEVRQIVMDENGKPIDEKLIPADMHRALWSGRYKKESMAELTIKALRDTWGENEIFTINVPDMEANVDPETGVRPTKEMRVRFGFTSGSARQEAETGTALSFYEIISFLDMNGINLTPQERSKLVEKTTRQGDRARAMLMREGRPGFDANVIKGVSRHIETMAHVVSKNMYGFELEKSMTNRRAFMGNKDHLNRLKEAVDRAENPAEKKLAEREYHRFAHKYAWSAQPVDGGAKTIKVGDKELKLQGRGNEAWDEARKLLAWYEDSNTIASTAGRVFRTEIGAKLVTATVAAHLGASPATAMINVAALATHTSMYLAYYNPRNGFGLGHGMFKSMTALQKALSDLALPRWEDAKFLDDLLDSVATSNDPQVNIPGTKLKRHEVEALKKATEFGWLAPAASDALVGSARGSMTDTANDIVRKWMWTFNYTEQMNRRTTLMATYRLEYERARQAGKTHEQASKMALNEAETALTASQGDYNMYNRPQMFRGDVMAYVFMYKMFTLMSVNLVARMSHRDKLVFLAALLVISGMKGLPFADDIMDLLDTLAQMFGIPMSGVEREAAKFIDSVAPGWSPYFLRGVLDQATGGTLSTRLGMGDLVPLTGALKHGADPWREFSDFAGPVFSVTGDLFVWSGGAARYGLEALGLADDNTKLETLLRESPASIIRAIGDSYAYLDDGAITNSRGQVVSKEAGWWTIATRLLGFYPAAATRQYDAIRAQKYFGEYSKAIKAGYVQRYVKADTAEERREVVRDVAEWNRAAKGTDFFIANFMKSAQRAKKSANETAAQRFLKSTPKAQRQGAMDLISIYGVE
jgi:hypothetical protein